MDYQAANAIDEYKQKQSKEKYGLDFFSTELYDGNQVYVDDYNVVADENIQDYFYKKVGNKMTSEQKIETIRNYADEEDLESLNEIFQQYNERLSELLISIGDNNILYGEMLGLELSEYEVEG